MRKSNLPLVCVALLAGCSPVLGAGGWPGVLLAVTVGGLLFLLKPKPAAAQRSVSSTLETGAPMPRPKCTGWEHKSCVGGRIRVDCCPEGHKCNYRTAPHVGCGSGTCVEGRDPSMCPTPEAAVQTATDEKACRGTWAKKVCIKGKVTAACLPAMPTNYMGPPQNPRFTECGDNRCSTTAPETCYPAAAEGKCAVPLTKVCEKGKVVERCLPADAPRSGASTHLTMCSPNRCVIGDKGACPR